MKNRSLFRMPLILAAAIALFATACQDPNGPGIKDDSVDSPTEYTITYNLNYGTNASTNPATYKTDTAVTLAAPTRSARVFVGWYESTDFNGSAVTSIPAGTTGDKVLYAKWSWASNAAGDAGPAGGKIVYVRPDGECDANAADGAATAWKYVESASANLPGNYVWSNITGSLAGCTTDWINPVPTYGSGKNSSVVPSIMVSGLANTNKIVSQTGHTTSVAQACLDYSVENGGTVFNDWYLPSGEELYYVALFVLTDGSALWTSSELPSNHGLNLTPEGFYPTPGSFNGSMYHNAATKNTTMTTRPVRHF